MTYIAPVYRINPRTGARTCIQGPRISHPMPRRVPRWRVYNCVLNEIMGYVEGFTLMEARAEMARRWSWQDNYDKLDLVRLPTDRTKPFTVGCTITKG